MGKCLRPGCDRPATHESLACGEHWRELPKDFRDGFRFVKKKRLELGPQINRLIDRATLDALRIWRGEDSELVKARNIATVRPLDGC